MTNVRKKSTYDIVNETNRDTRGPDTRIEIARLINRLSPCARHQLADILELGALRAVFQPHNLHRDLVPVTSTKH